MPRNGTPSPITVRSGGDPIQPDQKGSENARSAAAQNTPHLLRLTNTNRYRQPAHARAVVWPAAAHSSIRFATAEQQNAAGAQDRTGDGQATARRVAQPRGRVRQVVQD